MLCCCGLTLLWLTSSGVSAGTSGASTPFSLPVGSGALRHACGGPSAHVEWGKQGREQTTYLDEVLALSLRHQRLELGSGEGVDEAGLRHDQQQHLGSGEDGQLVCLLARETRPVSIRSPRRTDDGDMRWGEKGGGGRGRGEGTRRTFFMIPALRLEKVMWRRDLSWMNLISIFLRSRPGFSSSSSSASSARRLVPRFSGAAPLPAAAVCCSSSWEGEVFSSATGGMSAMMAAKKRENEHEDGSGEEVSL